MGRAVAEWSVPLCAGSYRPVAELDRWFGGLCSVCARKIGIYPTSTKAVRHSSVHRKDDAYFEPAQEARDG